jgi:hypothetical protein
MADGSSQQRKPDFRTAVEDVKAICKVLAADAESIFGRRMARGLGVLVLAAVIVTILFVLLNWYVAPTKPSGRKDLVLTLAQILGGTALLLGLYFTWRGQQNAQAQLEINRRGHVTERFTQAIDQLGSDNLEIRLGGIYSLERTAYEDRDHHWPVMEVLTAYVRQHAPRKPEEESGEHIHPPPPEIQAILTVIGRRSPYHRYGTFADGRKIEPGPIDLHDSELRGADLRGAHLGAADLAGAHLQRALLQGADLQRARLRQAKLQRVDLLKASLQGADLQGANLQRASLRGAHLQGAHLQGADFQKSRLRGADLLKARLQYADFREADLQEVKVTDEQLDEVMSLQGATMPDGSVHT